jgi:glutaredoxin 3
MGSDPFLGDNMIRTEEDDEFERIEQENRIKGQPYHWEIDAIKAAINIEREACARIADDWNKANPLNNYGAIIANKIRARGENTPMEILIYTKRKCPNCITAKMILRAENIRYVEIDVESNPALLSDLPENSRQTPQIFIDGQHVGGLAGLHAALTKTKDATPKTT